MAFKQRLGAIQTLYGDTVSVTTGQHKNNRYMLSDVYQMCIVAAGYFPKKPLSLIATMPANLRTKVDNGCSSCANQSDMDALVLTAKKTLMEYRRSLRIWLEANDVKLDEQGEIIPVPVKDLSSTLKIKT